MGRSMWRLIRLWRLVDGLPPIRGIAEMSISKLTVDELVMKKQSEEI